METVTLIPNHYVTIEMWQGKPYFTVIELNVMVMEGKVWEYRRVAYQSLNAGNAYSTCKKLNETNYGGMF